MRAATAGHSATSVGRSFALAGRGFVTARPPPISQLRLNGRTLKAPHCSAAVTLARRRVGNKHYLPGQQPAATSTVRIRCVQIDMAACGHRSSDFPAAVSGRLPEQFALSGGSSKARMRIGRSSALRVNRQTSFTKGLHLRSESPVKRVSSSLVKYDPADDLILL